MYYHIWISFIFIVIITITLIMVTVVAEVEIVAVGQYHSSNSSICRDSNYTHNCFSSISTRNSSTSILCCSSNSNSS